MKCLICDAEPIGFVWTDTHGVAQCSQCGAPYTVYHYEDGKRVEKNPTIAVLDTWIPLLREYWSEKHRVIPGGFSFSGGQELASREDADAFYSWADKNKHRAALEQKQ